MHVIMALERLVHAIKLHDYYFASNILAVDHWQLQKQLPYGYFTIVHVRSFQGIVLPK